ncbi:MAG: ATP-binding protein [Oscillospiraceae bacterium]|nr:ATP-binding protein [Oscillospiraceae bacterium]
MSALLNELIVYKNFHDDGLFEDMLRLVELDMGISKGSLPLPCSSAGRNLFFKCMRKLLDFSETYILENNIWQNYCTFVLINNENYFSLFWERNKSAATEISLEIVHDFKIMQSVFNYDLHNFSQTLGINHVMIESICNYSALNQKSKHINTALIKKINILVKSLKNAETPQEFGQFIREFYSAYGSGKYLLYRAFKIDNNCKIVSITNTKDIYLDDLVGYEAQKKQLRENTESFIKGHEVNNVLLFGDSGTGKSSSIKAILNEYASSGIRMIQIFKHQLGYLQDLINQIKYRNYYFIIYMDDLSFEDGENEYKYLKALIEGGLEERPQNIVIYATSNRRHLIKEQWKDREDQDEEVNRSDTIQEKLSLAARFGVAIFYLAPDRKEYNNIIKSLANKHNLNISEEELYLLANRWELRHGGLSGRTAQQFLLWLLGQIDE